MSQWLYRTRPGETALAIRYVVSVEGRHPRVVLLSNPKDTPRADPHAGCCGSRGRKPAGDPIRRRWPSAGTWMLQDAKHTQPENMAGTLPPSGAAPILARHVLFERRYRRKPHSRTKYCGFNSESGPRSLTSSSSGPCTSSLVRSEIFNASPSKAPTLSRCANNPSVSS